jgi:hypothetical protein
MAKKEELTIKVPSERKLKQLAGQYNTAKEKTSGIGGELGQAIRSMAEKDNLHPGAFRATMALLKKDGPILRNYLDHFEHYCEVLGVYKKAEDSPPLPIDGEEGDEDGEGADNVHRLAAAE